MQGCVTHLRTAILGCTATRLHHTYSNPPAATTDATDTADRDDGHDGHTWHYVWISNKYSQKNGLYISGQRAMNKAGNQLRRYNHPITNSDVHAPTVSIDCRWPAVHTCSSFEGAGDWPGTTCHALGTLGCFTYVLARERAAAAAAAAVTEAAAATARAAARATLPAWRSAGCSFR